MKKLFNNLKWWIFSKKRRKSIEKREKVYDDVISKLQVPVFKKKEEQKELISEIQTNFKKDFNISYDSAFIPSKFVNKERIQKVVKAKYGERMLEKGVVLTENLSFKCI